jgi:nucleotide-binding universal stress UspA family protein
MKIKRNRNPGSVLMELGPNERQLPGTVAEGLPRFSPSLDIKRVLVPMDFSDCSKKALVDAVHLAGQFDARVWLVYVRHPIYYAPDMVPFGISEARREGVSDNAEQRLQALAREVAGRDAPVETLIREGDPAKEIVAAAAELGADLIVVATHGYTGLKHLWHGSIAEKVVRYASCPVLVVRDQEHDFII